MSKIYVEVRSGLGNQLFQFAFAYALSQETNKEVVFVPSYFDAGWKYLLKKFLGREIRLFRLTLIVKDNLAIPVGRIKFKQVQHSGAMVLREGEIDIQKVKNVVSGNNDTYLKGYWQDPTLFNAYKKYLVEVIKPTFKLSKNCEETLKRIDHSYVAIHVRRGDFLTNKSFGACTIEYYLQAIDRIKFIVPNPVFLIFTNNQKWVRENFPKDISYSLYSNNQEKNTDVEEMYLMSNFKSLVISNSTFSWWAAYLNNIPDRSIICPKTWFLKPALQEKAVNFIFEDWLLINNKLELLNS